MPPRIVLWSLKFSNLPFSAWKSCLKKVDIWIRIACQPFNIRNVSSLCNNKTLYPNQVPCNKDADTRHINKYSCLVCRKWFKNGTALGNYKKKFHLAKGTTFLNCRNCDKMNLGQHKLQFKKPAKFDFLQDSQKKLLQANACF